TRTITAQDNVGPTDFIVGVLNEDVPETISFAKVPPADFADYIPGISNRLHCLALDYEEKAIVTDLERIINWTLLIAYPTQEDAAKFNVPIIPGDSGNPVFAIIGEDLVLLTTSTFGGAGGGGAT